MPHYKLEQIIYWFDTTDEASQYQPSAILITDEEAALIHAENEAIRKAEYEATLTYKDKRQAAHLPIQDQLDMQYHDAINGTTLWLDYVTAIKTSIPKE